MANTFFKTVMSTVFGFEIPYESKQLPRASLALTKILNESIVVWDIVLKVYVFAIVGLINVLSIFEYFPFNNCFHHKICETKTFH